MPLHAGKCRRGETFFNAKARHVCASEGFLPTDMSGSVDRAEKPWEISFFFFFFLIFLRFCGGSNIRWNFVFISSIYVGFRCFSCGFLNNDELRRRLDNFQGFQLPRLVRFCQQVVSSRGRKSFRIWERFRSLSAGFVCSPLSAWMDLNWWSSIESICHPRKGLSKCYLNTASIIKGSWGGFQSTVTLISNEIEK